MHFPHRARSWIAGAELFFTLLSARAEEGVSKPDEHRAEQSDDKSKTDESGNSPPSAQTLGKDVSGVFVNSTSSNSG
jgi:hypothetical protein